MQILHSNFNSTKFFERSVGDKCKEGVHVIGSNMYPNWGPAKGPCSNTTGYEFFFSHKMTKKFIKFW